MRRLACVAVGIFVAVLGAKVRAVTLGPATADTSAFVVLTEGVSNPFAGGTLLQTVTAPSQTLMGRSNISGLPFERATVSLTTQVYQLTAGRLGFAYTINAQSFDDALDPLDFGEALIPRLSAPGFGTAPADVNGSQIPTGFGVAPYEMTVFRRFASNDTLVYSFAHDTVPAEVPAFFSLRANGTITAFAAVDATAFQTATSVVTLQERDARAPATGRFVDFSFESLAPNLETPPGTPIPEPGTLGLLALAVGGLGWRLRRR